MNKNIIIKEFFKEVLSYFHEETFTFSKFLNFSYNIGFDKCCFNFSNVTNSISVNGRFSLNLEKSNFYGIKNFLEVMKYLRIRSFFESE